MEERVNSIDFIVTEYDMANGTSRLDQYLTSKNPDFSRSYIQKLIKDGMVSINDKTRNKPGFLVEIGMKITLILPEIKNPVISPEKMDLDILYEDRDVILINKPKGLVVHPAPGHYEHTLVNGLLYHCKDELSGINGELRPGIVHRIDKDTTGVIVVCKNDISHRFLSEQLAEHSIQRTYQAIVHNNFSEDSGTIDAPIGRHPTQRKKMAINYNNGKNAVTHYQVLNRLNKTYNHIECKLETGRTHQIRVHMASIQHPLLGDEVYGPQNISKTLQPLLQGQTLHAKTLGFIHPSTKKYMEFEAPLPKYFTQLLERFGNI